MWTGVNVGDGLLEQQVYLGWSIIALGAVAVVGWAWHLGHRRSTAGIRVPVLVVVALTALLCSLSPERAIGSQIVAAPSALLYSILPMFRAYARFGVVVQLMAVLLAGIGVDFLRRAARPRATFACVALVALLAVEYTVAPSAVWRDVLPTAAHRWVTRQPGEVRAFDCTPLNRNNQSTQWLTGHRVVMSSRAHECTEPNFAGKLAAGGYTHLLVRRDTTEGRWLSARTVEGLRVAADFEDAQVLAVTAAPPPIYTATMSGFFRREHSAKGTWRWMSRDAVWSITNTGVQVIVATLEIEMWPFQRPRTLELRLDGHNVQRVSVARGRHRYQLGPLSLPPGDHVLMFHATEPPTAADNISGHSDRRAVSIAVGEWKWTVRDEQE
jgi:hypothetical protein